MFASRIASRKRLKSLGRIPRATRSQLLLIAAFGTPRLDSVTETYTYPLGCPRIVTVTFLNVEDVPPLQGADITATENYWHAINTFRDGYGAQPRPHMRHYLTHMFAEGFLIDRARIIEMISDIEAQMKTFSADGR